MSDGAVHAQAHADTRVPRVLGLTDVQPHPAPRGVLGTAWGPAAGGALRDPVLAHFPPSPPAGVGLAPTGRELDGPGATEAPAPELQAPQGQAAEQRGDQDDGHVQPPRWPVLGRAGVQSPCGNRKRGCPHRGTAPRPVAQGQTVCRERGSRAPVGSSPSVALEEDTYPRGGRGGLGWRLCREIRGIRGPPTSHQPRCQEPWAQESHPGWAHCPPGPISPQGSPPDRQRGRGCGDFSAKEEGREARRTQGV